MLRSLLTCRYKFFLNVQMQRVLRRHVPADTSLTDKQRNLLRQVPNTHFNCKRAYVKIFDCPVAAVAHPSPLPLSEVTDFLLLAPVTLNS